MNKKVKRKILKIVFWFLPLYRYWLRIVSKNYVYNPNIFSKLYVYFGLKVGHIRYTIDDSYKSYSITPFGSSFSKRKRKKHSVLSPRHYVLLEELSKDPHYTETIDINEYHDERNKRYRGYDFLQDNNFITSQNVSDDEDSDFLDVLFVLTHKGKNLIKRDNRTYWTTLIDNLKDDILQNPLQYVSLLIGFIGGIAIKSVVAIIQQFWQFISQHF